MEGSIEQFNIFIKNGQNTLYALDWDYNTYARSGEVRQYATLVNDAEDKALLMVKQGEMFEFNYELVYSIPVFNNI